MPADALRIGLPEVERLAAACAGTDAQALCAAVDAWAQATLSHALCTVNRFDPETMSLRRLYSSDPQSYPPGGGKDKRGTPWGRHVLLEQKVFVGEGPQAIQAFFDDHRTIAALDLRSVVNVPLVLGGRCLGTLNFLMRAETVAPGHVACARLAGHLVLPALLARP